MEHIMLGETLLANVEVDWCRAKKIITYATWGKILMLEDEENFVHRQLEGMKMINGSLFWLQPIFHFKEHAISYNPTSIVKPYGFCLQGFHYIYIAITSYKHVYHPFCLGIFLRSNNKCPTCGHFLHLDWMRSWGFYNEEDVMKQLEIDMGIENLWEEMKQSLLEATLIDVLPYKFNQ